jgi:tRNA/tmRNA/rRNA uracil-C5-methylase (TrmA/RlmC/RlmD family)
MTRIRDLEITDLAFGGKGVARADGKAVFVPYVIDGERVSATIVRTHKKFFEAELENVAAPSLHRVRPRCPYFGRCGGCVYQHIDYEHQLAVKWRQAKETLRRIGGLKEPPMRPFIASPLEYEYRNRITVHVRDGVIGFFRRESNKLLDIERCSIGLNEVNERLAKLRASHPHDGDYTLRASGAPRVFTQANEAVAAALLDLVDRMLDSAQGTLVDAYCGAGFFSKRLRPRFERVIGIDWDQHAIALAWEDATEKETYVAADVEAELGTRLSAIAPPSHEENIAVIVDPPAAGLSKATVQCLIEHKPGRLVYVSCNPATLARDLAMLNTAFRIDSVTPLDMFPQTAEIECVAHLYSEEVAGDGERG